MKVIVTAGGTGGHIYPALAIVDKIKEIANFEPKVYTSNTDNFIKGVKNILDEIINS